MADDLEKVRVKFEHLKEKMLDPKFQKNEGLSNEVSYYIFDYSPKEALTVEKMIHDLEESPLGSKVNLKVFDIYKIMITQLHSFDTVTRKDTVEALAELEPKIGIEGLAEQVNNILLMTDTDNLIVKYIKDRLPEKGVVFITGLGKVFPLLRAHKILNTMNLIIDDIPVVFFYPGDYNRISLRAFGELSDQNYYRAFRID